MGVIDHIPPQTVRWLGRQQFRPYIGPIIKMGTRRLRNTPRIVGVGQAKGLRIDPAGTNAGYALGTTEPLIQDTFAEYARSGDVVWDIGANIGFYSLIASRLVGDGQVIAFEPLPENVASIHRNLSLNSMSNVRVVETALSDHSGAGELSVSGARTHAKLDTSGETDFKEDMGSKTIHVELSTVDLQLCQCPAPSLVKIDVEGAEAAVLRGAVRLLHDVRPTIICELHGTNTPAADLLEDAHYAVNVLATPDVPVREASWDAHIIAVPR